MKILFTIPNFITAGSGRAMLNIIERLDPERFEPSICVLKTGGELESEIAKLGIPLLELPFTVAPRPLPNLPLRVFRAAQRFRPYGFQIWHSFHYSDDYTEALIARTVGARAWIYTKKNMGWGSRAWRLRSLLATRIAAQNTAMLTDFFPDPRSQSKVRLIPRGVDTEKFQPALPPRLELRKQLEVQEDTLLIGCVAHILPVKDQRTLIRAVAQLPEVHLALAGKPMDEEYVSQLHQLIGELDVVDRIHFLGNVSDIPALHSELDVFVLPSLGRLRMEGCPVALLEAMACGRACIATDIPGSQDIIEHEKSGLLVPPENVEALAEAISRLQKEPKLRQQFGNAARERILEHYTIERELEQHQALYNELISQQG